MGIKNHRSEKISPVPATFASIKNPQRQIPFSIKVKFGVHKAFFIVFEMATSTKSLSVRLCLAPFWCNPDNRPVVYAQSQGGNVPNGNNPMDGEVHVDEFVLGGRDEKKIGRSYDSKKKKTITAVQLTDGGKVKRMYAMRIDDFSAKSLQYIFVDHISRDAKVTTDK